jgi:hypothetical protein
VRQDEFDSFRNEIKQLCASLGKPYTDPLGQAYWRALQDIPLPELESNVERILLNATKDTKFPRPSELRTTPAPRAQSSLEGDPKLKEAFELNRRNWDEQLEEGSPLGKWRLLSALLARIDVEEEPGSVFHAERMGWAKSAAEKLLRAYGQKWCVADPHIMHAASRLLGGEYIAPNYVQKIEKRA